MFRITTYFGTTLLLTLFLTPPLPGQQTKTPPERSLQLNVQSRIAYYGLLTAGPFIPIKNEAEQQRLQRIVNRLFRSETGHDYEDPIAIVESRTNADFINALILPGGEIFISRKLIETCRDRAREFDPQVVSEHYESLLAAVLAHELGHYLRREERPFPNELFATIMPDHSVRKSELDADNFAFRALRSAGYDPSYLQKLLQLLKTRTNQKRCGFQASKYPGLNERIQKIATGSDKELYTRLAGLEKAFDAIETGEDLPEATEIILNELKMFPQNHYLLTAGARVYHRRWEASCRVGELLFKASFVYTPFFDRMLESGSRSELEVCGNLEYYHRALTYYQKSAALSSASLSTYAVLLAYDRERGVEALRLSREALRENSRQNRNNHGIVLYLVGDSNAERFFVDAGTESKEQECRNQGGLVEAVFNLGQFYYLRSIRESDAGDLGKAREIWSRYVADFDDRSPWAKYALRQTNPQAGR